MRQLIISIYDCGTNFTYVVIDKGKEIKSGDNPKKIAKYGLYNDEFLMFDSSMIDFDKNKAIQEFDMIILCEDGCIFIYRKEEKRNENAII